MKSNLLEVENGQIKLTYDQFHSLYGQVVSAISNLDVEFQTDYDYLFLDVDLSKTFAGTDLPLINGFFNASNGQSYAPVFFNDNKIIFSDTFFFFFGRGSSYLVTLILTSRCSRLTRRSSLTFRSFRFYSLSVTLASLSGLYFCCFT